METFNFNYEKIKDISREKKIMQKTIFEALQMTKQNFDYLLKTGNITANKIAIVCEVLQCKPNDLFDIKEIESNMAAESHPNYGDHKSLPKQ